MVSRLERGIFDKVVNQMGLRKRNIAQPFRYNINDTSKTTRFWDIVFFPKNGLQRMISSAYEKSLPTLQYFIWNPMTYHARKAGWTEQEKLYHNFFRGDLIVWHSYAQSMHPSAYLERQRGDAFFRRIQTMLPGITIPDWAQNHKRAVDFDYEGMMNPYRAQETVMHESTPQPHYGYGYPSSIQHIGNYRWLLGRFAQRYFYNEELKGSYLAGGKLSEQQVNEMNSWYAGAKGSEELTPQTLEEKEEDIKNAQRWLNNIKTFYPEYQNYKLPPILSKIDEPYFIRNLKQVLDAIFIQKWTNAINNRVFTQSELQNIYEFYLQQRDDVFWAQNSEGVFEATPLYLKFVKSLELPNVFELEKYTSTVVEQQYLDILQHNYGVTIDTVSNYAASYETLVRSLPNLDEHSNNKARLYLSEEVYNPLFKNKIHEKLQRDVKGSYVAELLNQENVKGIELLESIANECLDELHFMSSEVQEAFNQRVRNLVKTFVFKPQTIPEVKF